MLIVIEEAFERCGLEACTGYDAKTARRSLNIMFAEWANWGVNLWTIAQTGNHALNLTATYTFDATYTDLLNGCTANKITQISTCQEYLEANILVFQTKLRKT